MQSIHKLLIPLFTILFLTFAFIGSVEAQGNALNFTSGSDRVYLYHNLAGANTYTFEAWVKSENTATASSHIARIACIGSYSQRLEIGDCQGKLTVFDGTTRRISGTNLRDGQYHHVAVSKKPSGQYKVYLDGNLVLTANDTHTLRSPFTIGAFNSSNSGNSQWKGDIDDIRLWDRALLGFEILSQSSCELTGNEPDLEGYWNCNQGIPGGNNSGNTSLNNSVSGGSNGSLISFSLNGNTSNCVLSGAGVENCQPAASGSIVIRLTINGDCNDCPIDDISLAGYQFDIYDHQGNLITVQATNSDGVLNFNPEAGVYIVTPTAGQDITVVSPIGGLLELNVPEGQEPTFFDFEFCLPPPDDGICSNRNINLSTGIDMNGNLIPLGAVDPFWQLINTPPLTAALPNGTTINIPNAIAITRNGDPGWNGIPNTRALNVINTDIFNPNNLNTNQPWIFRRAFCVEEDGNVNIAGSLRGDDQAQMFLFRSDGTLVINTPIANTNNGNSPNIPNFRQNWPIAFNNTLTAGQYFLEVRLLNTGSGSMGFAAQVAIDSDCDQILGQVQDGCCAPTGVITVQKLDDLNCDGVLDPNEPSLSGWEFTITDQNGNTVQPNVTTDMFGQASFSGLPFGTYTITETVQNGWVVTNPANGSAQVTIDNNNQVIFLNFLNCDDLPPMTCPEVSVDSQNGSDCCPVLNYSQNGDPQSPRFIRLSTQAGTTYNTQTVMVANGVQLLGSAPTSLTIGTSDGSDFPATVSNMISFCFATSNSNQQTVTIEYLDVNFNVLCQEDLTFGCIDPMPCLEVSNPTVECDEGGYLVDFTVTNPIGGNINTVGFIVLNITDPQNLVQEIELVISPPLQPGESRQISELVVGPNDGFGDQLCITVTAHETDEELVCCAVEEFCLDLPLCDPCPQVNSSLKQSEKNTCCYTVLVENNFTANPGLFTAVTVELTSGSNGAFDSADPTIFQAAGLGTFQINQQNASYTFVPNSGGFPIGQELSLMNFCLDGATSNPQSLIRVTWHTADPETVCEDVLSATCYECLRNTSLPTAIPCPAPGEIVTYDFTFLNLSGQNVNAVRLLETPGDAGELDNNGQVYHLGSTVAPGQSSTISIPIRVVDLDGDLNTCVYINLQFYNTPSSPFPTDCCTAELCFISGCFDPEGPKREAATREGLTAPSSELDLQTEPLGEFTPISSPASTNNDHVNLRVFPNPVDDLLTIISSASDKALLSCLDYTGRKLRQLEVDFGSGSVQLSTVDFNPGLYILRLDYPDGSHQQLRFVKR